MLDGREQSISVMSALRLLIKNPSVSGLRLSQLAQGLI
jgi:hypothetical protein